MSDPEQGHPGHDDSTCCPDENELVDFLQGALSVADRARVESHCANCERCRQTLGAAATSQVPPGATSSGSAVQALRHEIACAVRGLLDTSRADVHAASDSRIGQCIGRFAIVSVLGWGQFGVVYRARDTELGRMVAVKLMRTGRAGPRNPALVEALLRTEAAAAARLQHPNIVTLYDYGVVDGAPYLILELLEGETLRDRIERGVRIGPREALAIAGDVTRGLIAAHAAGVIHRDIKPGNVFICTSGRSKILDFGLARLLDTAEHGAAAHAGTPRYMAPELFDSQPADACSDVYAVGVTLLDLLAGPPAVPDHGTLAERIDRAPVSAQLRRLLRDLTATRRSDRLQNAEELLAQLTRAQRDLANAPRASNRWLGMVLIGVLAAVAAAAIFRSHVGAARNPCSKVMPGNNGQYCGTSIQAGFRAQDALPNAIYECVDGQVASVTRCSAECFINPTGLPDSCSANDPCTRVSRDWNGTYCGHSTQNGFSSDIRSSQDLFTCEDGAMVDSTRCETSCIIEAPGIPDHCTPDPCARVSHGDNGTYCGSSPHRGFNRQNSSFFMLYTCTDGRTSAKRLCVNGCTPGPAGGRDDCH